MTFPPSSPHKTALPLARAVQRRDNTRRQIIVALTSNDLKNGLNIELDGTPMRVVEFLHVKPGKGAAFVRSKLKNLISGTTMEKTFRAGESVEEAVVIKMDMQFSYDDGEAYQFMNLETYETESVPKTAFSSNNQGSFLLEGMVVQITKWNERAIDVELPPNYIYEVVETDPNFKGNTAQGGSKPAKLNSGATVTVPMFIEVGEKIKVDTREATYVSRGES
eukprot:evm.model.NODE_34840_length_33638_cov_20.784470.7